MSVDMFSRTNALKLLDNKELLFFGDSNMRSIYKDLVWLLEYGTLVPQRRLKVRNEEQHANDFNTSNKPLTSGRDYEETREYYNGGTVVKFTFLTKIFSENLVRAINSRSTTINAIIVINSCVWDLSRWGPNGVAKYKKNVIEIMKFFKSHLSTKCRVIFTTTLPLSSSSNGGFLKPEIEFLRNQLPWHVIEANTYLAEIANLYKYDVLDLHYYTRFLRNEWMRDGIHWSPLAYRLLTNFILTHISLSFNPSSSNSNHISQQNRKQKETVTITNTNNKIDATSASSVIQEAGLVSTENQEISPQFKNISPQANFEEQASRKFLVAHRASPALVIQSETQYFNNKDNDTVESVNNCKTHQLPTNVVTIKTEEMVSVDLPQQQLMESFK